MGWAGVKNGKLLAVAVEEFDVFVTVDRNLSFRQNIPQFDIAVVVLQAPSNSLAALKPLASNLLAVLDSANKGQVTVVTECDRSLLVDRFMSIASISHKLLQ